MITVRHVTYGRDLENFIFVAPSVRLSPNLTLYGWKKYEK